MSPKEIFELVLAGGLGWELAGFIRDIATAGIDFTVKAVMYRKALNQIKNKGSN